MIYLHDVYVNWVDGGSRRHEIPEYFEWKQEDTVELYDTVPLVKVTPDLFNALEDGYEDIPRELLSEIFKLARRVNPETHRKNFVDYCFVATDGHGVIAINTEKDTKPNLKSRLVLRQEQFVILDAAPSLEAKEYDFIPEEYEMDDTLEGQLLAANSSDYLGLTRVEKGMKQIVLECLYNLSLSDNRSEVFYWFVELFPDLNKPVTLAAMNIETMIEEMFSFLRKGWSEDHVAFGTNMVKVSPNDIFKGEWDELIKQADQKDKVEL